MYRSITILTMLTTSIIASSCLFGEKKADKMTDTANLTWPEVMTKHLEDSGYQRAYGLFSSSGWSNVGQVMVYDGHPSKPMQVEWVDSNGKALAGTYTLVEQRAQSLRAIFKTAAGLKDVEPPVFDGVQFTYRHIEKDKRGAIKVKHKIFMNNPDQADPKPDKHLALINAMLALKKKEADPKSSPKEN